MLGFSTQVVVAVMPVLPGLLALPATRVKFTAWLERVRVIESGRTAFSEMGLAPVFSTCARPGAAYRVAKNRATTVPNLVSIRIARFFLRTSQAQVSGAHTEVLRLPPRRWSCATALVPGCSAFPCRRSQEAEAACRCSGRC